MEKDLILRAVSKAKKKVIPNSHFDDNDQKTDAIDLIVKRQQRKERFRILPSSEWVNADFLNYLHFLLKGFGVTWIRTNRRKESNDIDKLYDALVGVFKKNMSNEVLKTYLDWWCHQWASRCPDNTFYVNFLLRNDRILKFVHDWPNLVERNNTKISISPIEEVTDSVEYTSETIFEMGGLPLLMIKRGIVDAYHFLMNKNCLNAAQQIMSASLQMSDSVLRTVLTITAERAPYKGEPIDFKSMVRILNDELFSTDRRL